MLTDRIKACTLLEDLMIPDDGYIGIPVRACVLFDKDSFKIKHGHGGTPIVLYVKGTAIERIGTLSDDEILCGMLDRGYVIFVLDYLGDKRAVPPMLDWSVQKIRTDMGTGKYFADIECLGAGRYVESMVVPSGYDVADGVFWSIDKHAADGTLEKIAEIWNNDLCGTNAERVVRWVDGSGVRKPTRMATDGTLPVWLDANGCECERGEYIKLKYTFVRDVVDCSRPDGTPIDLDLHMILIYPTKPAKRVPVMCLSGSSEGLRRGSATADRPHLNGFVFRGYMGVMFDYGYTPMAKDDQYGYFDGFPKAGYVTGDNVTYSINHYNDKRIFTAAMRYIRYLGETDERFFIKEDAIGLYGNSKGAWMTFLGEDCDATALNSPRMFAGHHDETRYESGNGAARGFVRAAEPQPWQEVNGKRLSSRAAFIYSSTGGTDNFITENHTPMYISCNRRDSSCYSTSNAFVNVCKRYDVPTMWFEIPSAHTLAYGNDLLYGTDTYSALFDFTGYYLHGDPVRAIAARVNGWAEEKSVTLKLSGAVPASEIAAASLKSENGTVEGKWVSAFGGVEWTFVPTSPLASGEYTLTVPETVSGDNGKRISEAFTYTFKLENRAVASLGYAGESTPLVLDVTDAEVYKLAFYAKEGINTVSAYTEGGEVIGSANVCGEGLYYIDLTDYLRATSLKSVKVYLKAENRERETVFTSSSGCSLCLCHSC